MNSLKCVLRVVAFVLPVATTVSALAAPNEGALPDAPTDQPPPVREAATDDPFEEPDAAPAPPPAAQAPVTGAVEPDAPADMGLDEETSEPTDADAGLRSVSLTFSPLHLFMPVLELTGEVRLARKFGVAVIGGYGQVTSDDDVGTTNEPLRANVYEVGAQARFYAAGSFDHGMEIGVEALYLHLDADNVGNIVASGSGLAVGPFAGYKIATRAGFTFDGQLGLQYLAVQAEAHDTETSESAEGEESGFIPLLNVNVGWSF